MVARTKHTIIYEEERPAFVVVPYDDYRKMAEDNADETTIPHEVIELMVDNNCNLIGAWRRYRGMTQVQFATAMDISQGAASQMEKTDNPQKETRKTAAAVLDCLPKQLEGE